MVSSEKISAIMMLYTGSLAEQVIKGVIKIVINLSFTFSMFLVLIMAGIAHAVPETKGTILLPFKPKGRKNLSIKKITLAIYPESSSK